jgi:hypothetical protein
MKEEEEEELWWGYYDGEQFRRTVSSVVSVA